MEEHQPTHLQILRRETTQIHQRMDMIKSKRRRRKIQPDDDYNDDDYIFAKTLFETSWVNGKCPQILGIKYIGDRCSMNFSRYFRRRYENRSEWCFHGTRIENAKQIARFGFEVDKSGKNFKCLSFGRGIYLAAHSSKAAKYAKSNDMRVVLLCKVYLGRIATMDTRNQYFERAPHGFDSIYGEPGRDFKDPEYVVYDPQQVKPEYVIRIR